jgi:hypothetical protein
VIGRWHPLFSAIFLSERHLRGEELLGAELTVLTEVAEAWRERSTSVSRLMRGLNDHVARKANEEDG